MVFTVPKKIFFVPDPFLGSNNTTIVFCGEFCTENWGDNMRSKMIYGTSVLFFQFLIPLSVITFCYTRICIRLGKGMSFRNKNNQKTERQKLAAKRKHRTNRMLIGMVCFFAFCWLPQVTLNLLRDFDSLPRFIAAQENFFQICCHFVAMTTTFWNPFLYAYLNEQYRAAFIQILPCLRWYFKHSNLESEGSTKANATTTDVEGKVRIRKLSASTSRDKLSPNEIAMTHREKSSLMPESDDDIVL